MNIQMSPALVQHIAQLAHLPVSKDEEETLAKGFQQTLKVVDMLFSVDTSKIIPTYQVTGLVNVLRDDAVDTDRMFSQSEALVNASETHNGYIVVNQILEEK